jgi:glycosyltransferase involved in cell wall biosynthesis
MRVLLWTQYFWPEHFHINEIAVSLRETGVEVTVLTGKPNYPDGRIFPGYRALGLSRERYRQMDVVRVPLRARGSSGAIGLALNYVSFMLSGYLIAPFALRRRAFDVVFVYAPSPILQALPAILVARIKRVPIVLWIQDLWPEALLSTGVCRNPMLLQVVERTVRYIYRRSDVLLIQSQAFRSPTERLTEFPQKIYFHPNSVAERSAKPCVSAATEELRDEISKYFSIVYAGNIGVVQGIETVVEAARRLRGARQIRFYLIGKGRKVSAIAAEIERAGIDNVVMPGQVPPEEICTIYDAASVLLVSMKDDASIGMTIPNKLQVYMAAAKPIIVSGAGEPARVLLEARAGLVCPPEDAAALADSVMRLSAMSAQERSQLGHNGREWFEKHYRLDVSTEKLIAHFKNAMARHNSRFFR